MQRSGNSNNRSRHWLQSLITLIAVALAPQHTLLAASELEKVGEARLQVMFWSVYDSRLYAEDGVYRQGKRPLKLEIQYLRDISAEDLVKRTGKEWEEMGATQERKDEWMDN